MIINGVALLAMEPIVDMYTTKSTFKGTSFGLSEVGYDIRLKQDIQFVVDDDGPCIIIVDAASGKSNLFDGRFCLASSMEEFDMPENLMGRVHDKSTWAREGVSVFNTVIEPGWKGFLTLEIVFHGQRSVLIPAGAGIAQVVFEEIICPARYDGKYQNQADMPVKAIRA